MRLPVHCATSTGAGQLASRQLIASEGADVRTPVSGDREREDSLTQSSAMRTLCVAEFRRFEDSASLDGGGEVRRACREERRSAYWMRECSRRVPG